MVYKTIKAFSDCNGLNYSTVKKWKQRGHIICNINGSIDDEETTNRAFLEIKGIIKESNGKHDSEGENPAPESVPSSEGRGNFQRAEDLSPVELDRLYKVRRINELESKIKRLEHRYNQDRGIYIERNRAVDILITALKSIVTPLADFGRSPVAAQIVRIYEGNLAQSEKEKRVSEIMFEYARNFEDSLVEAERKLNE